MNAKLGTSPDTTAVLRWIRDHRAHPDRLTLDEARQAVRHAWDRDLRGFDPVERGFVESLADYAARATWVAMTDGTSECRWAFRQGHLVEVLASLPQ